MKLWYAYRPAKSIRLDWKTSDRKTPIPKIRQFRKNPVRKLSSGAHEHFYIKTSTVHVGEPPLGAQRCVNFEAMKKAWEFKAKSQCYHLPAVFDPVARANPQLRKKYKRRKGTTNNENQYVWEERYLRFVHKEFKEKNSADNEMIARHMIEKASGEEGSDGELNFQFHVAPTFFLPGVYKMLC
uniref:Uncharacterized protein n=1 Tax=Caenorhabditis japonica TaxID=281687 RepID=A0A8R1I6M1_CAEJA